MTPGPGHKEHGYKHIGENPCTTPHHKASDVGAALRETQKEGYFGYLIIYLLCKKVREEVCEEFFSDIYTAGYRGQEGLKTLPGGVTDKFLNKEGRFFQIFWNPGIETCSGTHWDDNDSILCLLQVGFAVCGARGWGGWR